MSADDWSVCPRCREHAVVELAAALTVAQEAYGKVPPAEFDALRARAATPLDEEALTTFREDYEFYGVEEGTITATYHGECETCGLTVSFRDEHPFWSRMEEAP